MKNKAVGDLSEAICDVINSFTDRVSVSEITGVLEIVKHIYIMGALEQEDNTEEMS